MAVSAEDYEVVGGRSLKARLKRAERHNIRRAYGLILPLFAFIIVFFVIPIGVVMFRSVDNPLLSKEIPKTIAALANWDPAGAPTPPAEVYKLFAQEMARDYKKRTIGRVATRLNYELGGMRGLVMKTARKIGRMQTGPFQKKRWKDIFLGIDKRWGQRDVWATIKKTGRRYTDGYYLSALDLTTNYKGDIVEVGPNRRIYVQVFIRTLWISMLVTVFCILLGYPVAYLLANLRPSISNLLMILVLLPFWTSLLVRTTAWVVVLQTNGVLNDLLMFLGLIHKRPQLIYNRFGVIVAMTHILLPFMILPIYSVMKNVSPSYSRAARSLGANAFTAFWRVYFPQTVAGIGAGGILVFILALGYYITPALVGGPNDQMASYFIAYHTNSSLNWGLASALGGILLAGVLAIYVLYNKIVGIDNMKLG